jgi:L-lactate dehydrogenase complex protein LldG
MVNERLVDLFAAKAAEAGARVERLDTPAAARRFLAAFLAGEGIVRVATAPDALAFVPAEAGLDVIRPADLRGYGKAEAGIVRADYGVAATGTLVHRDAGDEDRIVWTLPPLCVCFLARSSVVGELEDIAADLAGHLGPKGAPGFSQVSLVTGPSRTADIEAELTLGVHGPGRLLILLHGA